MSVRIGVVSMDELPVPARSIGGDYPSLYGRLLRGEPAGETFEIVDYAGHRSTLPAAVTECDGWLFGGSRRSVYEDEPWIRDTEDFVRAATAVERPVVGICFGHQLVAAALGGTVEAAPAGWGLGAREYAAQPLPWFPDDRCTLVASHRDQVTALPPDAAVWASADYCPIAGMTIGEHVWTIQGHPEFGAAVADALYVRRTGDIGAEAVAAARSTLDRPLSNASVGQAIARFVGRRW